MVFIIWINKMLNFSHLEFSYSQQALSRINFVSETQTNLCSSKWHLTIVEFIESSEVQEDTLGCLWSQVTSQLSGWTNLITKHEVELDSL